MNLDGSKIEKSPLHTNKQEKKVRYTYTILICKGKVVEKGCVFLLLMLR